MKNYTHLLDIFFFLIIFGRKLVFYKTDKYLIYNNKKGGIFYFPAFFIIFQKRCFFSLLHKRFQQFSQIADEHTYRNCQQYNTEQFTQHIHKRFPENLLDQKCITQNQIHDNDIQHQRDENIGQALQSSQRQ